jgi:hypothetical protein
MGERGGVQHYLYWSDRRIRQFLDDQDIAISERTQRKLSSPTFNGFAPTVQMVFDRAVPYKPELANKVERALGALAVSDFDVPAPITFARGCGTVTFSEFVDLFDESKDADLGYPRHALMYSRVLTRSGLGVGICLFGSMQNYADYVKDAENHSKEGWTASSAPAVTRFLRNRCTEGEESYSQEELARQALQIANAQGVRNPEARNDWNRGFTFGDARDVAEWLAEIWYDCDFRGSSGGPGWEGIERVLIGAPYWVRTPSLRAVNLYSQVPEGELDAIEKKRRRNEYWRTLIYRLFGRNGGIEHRTKNHIGTNSNPS